MGNQDDRGSMCMGMHVCAYINKKKPPRSSTENKKLNT